MNKISRKALIGVAGCCVAGAAFATANDIPSEFSNQGSIANTRHNMTQRQASGGGPNAGIMDAVRNDYQQVCVYCHTPHSANQNIEAPLWNRTVRSTTYTLYNQQSLSGEVTQPGPNSLMCLSCHDGQTAIDSIVNMPGSGGYNQALELDPNRTTTYALLDAWKPNDDAWDHWGLNQTECLSCHSGGPGSMGGATNFTAAALGTDLSNDHPVGIKLPATADFNGPNATYKNILFYDRDGDGRPDKDELRFYDSGQGFEVECASCHDPHGVSDAGGTFLPTFLRVSVDGSQVCLTCHVK